MLGAAAQGGEVELAAVLECEEPGEVVQVGGILGLQACRAAGGEDQETGGQAPGGAKVTE
jgi:hypothetical protein